MTPKKVLIVDDNKDYSELLTNGLSKDGFETKVMESAKSALEVLRTSQYSPDLLIVDMMMPSMSGLEFLEELKEIELENSPKVCVLSAKNNVTEIEKSFKLGAHEYFLKSDGLVIMIEKIYELMEFNKRPRPDKNGDFISVLEITNVIHDFKIIKYDENEVVFNSAEELPLNSIVQIKNDKLKTFRKSLSPISCQVQDCKIDDSGIVITCNYTQAKAS